MPTHVALLRGINLGGQNRVAMAELRAVVESLGHTDVVTYIQSGNVVFTAAPEGAADSRAGPTVRPGRSARAGVSQTESLATALEEAIADSLDVRPRVVVLTRDQLAEVVAANPFDREPNPKNVHALFLASPPGPEVVEAVAAANDQVERKGRRDSARLVGQTIFLHTPGGYGRSDLPKLIARVTDRHPHNAATARNWATVTKLLTLCDSGGGLPPTRLIPRD